MKIVVSVVVGAMIGWLASLLVKTDGQGIALNVALGLVGALFAGLVITPLIGEATINQNDVSLASLVVSLIGAVVLLAAVNLFRRGAAR